MTPIRTVLLAAVIAVAAFAAHADVADRDVLVTTDGVLYTMESVTPESLGIESDSRRVLNLTVQIGQETQNFTVPATLGGGINANPALAFDQESRSLFVIWQRTPMPQMTSDLLFSSYQNGRWSEATLINNAGFEIRTNLRLATTRHYFERGPDQTMVRKPGLILHVVWWTETGRGENAGYAMLRLENGAVKSIQNAVLPELLGEDRKIDDVAEVPFDFNREILRHPTISDNAAHDAVNITFADWTTNYFRNITINPIAADGVLEPPTGIRGGKFGPPGAFNRNIEPGAAVHVLPSPDRTKLLFHFRNGNAIDFLSVDTATSTWSGVRSVQTGDKLSAEGAVEALRRMISSE